MTYWYKYKSYIYINQFRQLKMDDLLEIQTLSMHSPIHIPIKSTILIFIDTILPYTTVSVIHDISNMNSK